MIVVQGISKKFGSISALSDVSLTIPQGQVVGLLGQNGAGKSTLLNILSGYLPPSSGQIMIDRHNMLTHPLEAKSSIGYLPENPPLYPEMTVEEYLYFCCRLKRVETASVKEHIEEILDTTGLSQVRRRLIHQLSKGFRQRTGLAQALCGTPKVLLLDEPTSGFDPAQVVEFRKTIHSLAKTHTIVFSSHFLGEVQSICQRILVLHQGRLVLDRNLSSDQKDTSILFHARIAMKKERLLPAVQSLPSVIRVKPLSGTEEITELQITARPDRQFQQELFQLLSGLQAPILELNPLKDSIEDVFMRITSSSALNPEARA